MEKREQPLPEKTAQSYLLVVGGATASGKTSVAIRLARHFRTEILSADSRQFYREMSIGTARPTPAELKMAPHHFIGHISIDQSYTVGDFERDALQELQRLFRQHQVVVLCGGSGLFIKALCEGLDEFPEVPESVRRELQLQFRQQGLGFLQEELRRSDPNYYREVDLQNHRRLLRALEVIRASGQPFSSFRGRTPVKRPFQPIYLQMDWPRDLLYQRINERVDDMMDRGLVEEARGLFPHRHLAALQTVGYQELFDYFLGSTSLEEAISLIKRNTRRYAKRQLTWIRRDGFWKSFHPEQWEPILAYLAEKMEA